MATEAIEAIKYAPRRIQTILVSGALVLLGSAFTEIYHYRMDRIEKVEKLEVEHTGQIGDLSAKYSALEVQIAAYRGQQSRIEDKVDRLNDSAAEANQKLNLILRGSNGTSR